MEGTLVHMNARSSVKFPAHFGPGFGGLPPGPNSYMKMPIYKPNSVTVTRGSLSAKPLKVTVTSTAREMPHEPTDANPSHGSYMSREMWRDPDKRTRHDRHHEEGKGWRSRWHPKVLDYRTVDELGLTIEELDNERLPKTAVAKAYAEQLVDNMLIEGEELLIEEGKITLQPTTLQPDRTVYGEIKPVNKKRDTQFCFYKINVPDRDIPVGLKVTVVATQGDPDVYVCNRNTFPMQHPHEHTWKSQQAGDDTILIEPHDPSFFPGLFFISVFALNDSAYELTCTFEPQKVKIHRPIVSDGNGYQQVREQIKLSDTRRRFCKHGLGFKEQLDSPRSLHGSTPPPPSPRRRPLTPRAPGEGDWAGGGGGGGGAGGSFSARPQTAPAPGVAPPSIHPALAKALGGVPNGAPGQPMGYAAACAAHPPIPPQTAPQAGQVGGAASPRESLRCRRGGGGGSSEGGSNTPSFMSRRSRENGAAPAPSVADIPIATRQGILRRTVRAATPRSRPESTYRDALYLGGRGGGDSDEDESFAARSRSPQRPSGGPSDQPTTPRSAQLATQFGEDAERLMVAASQNAGGGGGGKGGGGGGAAASAKKGGAGGAAGSSFSARASRRSSSPTSSAVQSALGALNRGRRSPVQQGEEERGLSDIQKLERFDEGGDVLDTVVSFIAAQANVSADVIAARDRVPIEERVTLGKSEFNGMQSLLTQRLKHTLAAQDAARSNAYRFRAKAMQHLDLGAAGSWSPERALGLVNSESLKMKEAYDQNLAQHLDEISLRQEEARSAQERQMARQRLRTAFGAGQAGVRIMRAAKMAGAGKSGASPRAAQTGRRGSVRSSRESVRSTSSKESS